MKKHLLKFIPLLSFLFSLHVYSSDKIPIPNPALAPFYHGVASGDPTPTNVIIWTRITPVELPSEPLTVRWELSTDTNFINVLQSGSFTTDSTRDFTVKVDVGNLSSYTGYYYRFISPDGKVSLTGRTKTAPDHDEPNLRFIVASCSSIFSGYFNSYRRIAENRDLDLVIHVGDYIYDSVDPDEEVRVPDPAPHDPKTLAEWRGRYAYYRLDPDLRAAHQQHPFIVLPDNHDFSWNSNYTMDSVPDALQAFYEWIPAREPADKKIFYRDIPYGNLVDIIFLDATHYNEIPAPTNSYTEKSRLGQHQWEWFKTQIKSSTAKWHLIATQKQFGQWELIGLPFGIYPGLSFAKILGSEDDNWEGFNDERVKILKYLRDNAINNNIFLTGDVHMGFADDLVENPFDPTQYNTINGGKSVGVEFLPYSITRINLDEKLHHLFPPSFYSDLVIMFMNTNRHQVFENLIDHGYGILDVRQDKSTVEFWSLDKYHVDSTQIMQGAFNVLSMDNHYQRQRLTTTTVAMNESIPLAPFEMSNIATFVLNNNTEKAFTIFPNPTSDIINIQKTKNIKVKRIILIDAATGKNLASYPVENDNANIRISLKDLSSSTIYVILENDQLSYAQKVIIQK